MMRSWWHRSPWNVLGPSCSEDTRSKPPARVCLAPERDPLWWGWPCWITCRCVTEGTVSELHLHTGLCSSTPPICCLFYRKHLEASLSLRQRSWPPNGLLNTGMANYQQGDSPGHVREGACAQPTQRSKMRGLATVNRSPGPDGASGPDQWQQNHLSEPSPKLWGDFRRAAQEWAGRQTKGKTPLTTMSEGEETVRNRSSTKEEAQRQWDKDKDTTRLTHSVCLY